MTNEPVIGIQQSFEKREKKNFYRLMHRRDMAFNKVCVQPAELAQSNEEKRPSSTTLKRPFRLTFCYRHCAFT